ncbi:MAG: glycosyltransferase [Chloroflexi bacterium]|nr:glycosyltransferase [Chloroflexota bacterium]
MLTSSYPRWAGDGAGIYVMSLAQTLIELGHDIYVIAPWDPAVKPMDTKGVHLIRFKYAPARNLHILGHGRSLIADVRLKAIAPLLVPCYAVAMISSAVKLYHHEHYELIHAHWSVPGGFLGGLVSKYLKLPLVISMHGSDVFVTEHSKMYARAAKIGFRQAYCVTAVSQHLLDRSVSAGLDPRKGHVVSCGVDAARFAQGDGQRMRSRLGIAAGAPVIGAIGRLVFKKGFSYLIDAMPRVLQSFPMAKCIIAGEGDLKSELIERTKTLGIADAVQVVGHIDWQDTPDFYAMCDVLALPSVVDAHGNVDGQPNVLLEAMAAGRAVVASNIPGIDSLVQDGVNGRLVSPKSVEDISCAVIEILGNPMEGASLSKAARELVKQFQWRDIADRFSGIYMQACVEK